MKRLVAMFIDLAFTQIIFLVFSSGFTIPNNNFSELLYRMSNILSFLAYCFVFDYFFDGRTIGKMIVGIRTIFMKNNSKIYCLTHGILRLFFYVFFPISAVYYFFINRGKLPYDSWFCIKTVDKE